MYPGGGQMGKPYFIRFRTYQGEETIPEIKQKMKNALSFFPEFFKTTKSKKGKSGIPRYFVPSISPVDIPAKAGYLESAKDDAKKDAKARSTYPEPA